jgi:phosphoglycerol transferase MdoB-like AlkP superfamily enzyme
MRAYLFRRAAPFAAAYLFLQCVFRIVLFLRERANIDAGVGDALRAFAIGGFFDVAALGFMLLPLVAYLLFLPSRRHLGNGDRRTTAVLYALFLFLMLFDLAAEWAFWDEFATRFNFIAVDYLIYTQEVLGNIWESYPVPMLLGLLALGAALLYWPSRRFLMPQGGVPSFRGRLVQTGVWAAATAALFFASSLDQTVVSRNQYVNEIAGDGLYGLFSAFRQNELDYARFYRTEDTALVSARVRSLLQKDAPFLDANPDSITRAIRHEGPEKRMSVVLVVMESMSAEYMGTFGNTLNITPNLDRLAKESLFFSNLYATGPARCGGWRR